MNKRPRCSFARVFGHVLPEIGKEKLGKGAEQANNRTSASYLLLQLPFRLLTLSLKLAFCFTWWTKETPLSLPFNERGLPMPSDMKYVASRPHLRRPSVRGFHRRQFIKRTMRGEMRDSGSDSCGVINSQSSQFPRRRDSQIARWGGTIEKDDFFVEWIEWRPR